MSAGEVRVVMEDSEAGGELAATAAGLKVSKAIVLVGLMGVGKTTVGRKLAQALKLAFKDADAEIEAAAGLSVKEIFARYGEADFRRGERLVIKRILRGAPLVLATGGGAFMDPATRAAIRAVGVSVWLRSELDLLVKRVDRREDRPLLAGRDARAVLAQLMAERHPIYAEADVVVDTGPGPPQATAAAILKVLRPVFGLEEAKG